MCENKPPEPLTEDELEILRVWRECPPFATLTLQKHSGELAHGEVTTKFHKPGKVRKLQEVPPRDRGD
jgi:hypothetical protein